MPLSRSRDYLSIGEVLESLRTDFPDISISKIRFLESEGLITPQRTGAGYRKFYDADVARLRHVLSLQRDHFLPLRVIKDRLLDDPSGTSVEPRPSAYPDSSDGGPDAAEVSLGEEELMKAAGLSPAEREGLAEFGVLPHRDRAYDADDLAAAKAAQGLFEYGVEPRHLRMYRQFADREAAFLQQIVLPVTKQRDPEGKRAAADAARRLLLLSRQLSDALVRSAMNELV